MEPKPQRWFAELLRRRVFRVAVAYLVVAWVLDLTPAGIARTPPI